MIIVGHMLGFEGTLADLFDVFIQLGAILSVLVVYREKFKFILNTHHWFRRRGPSVLNVAISMFPVDISDCKFFPFLFWPGFSRSGSTIAGSLLLGISRKAAADFTFIMAVPLMFLACTFDLIKVIPYLQTSDFGILAVGFFTAFIVAYASILWFLKFLNNSTLTGFAVYRFFVAIVAFIYFW